jgi:hypothetical protein
MKPARAPKVAVVVVTGGEEKVKGVAKVGTVVVAAGAVAAVAAVAAEAAGGVADDLNRIGNTATTDNAAQKHYLECDIQLFARETYQPLPHDLPTDHCVFFPAPVIFFRVTDIVVQPAAFLAVVGAFDDQFGYGGDVAQFDEVR